VPGYVVAIPPQFAHILSEGSRKSDLSAEE